MYQWFHEGSILPGETNPTLTLTDVMVSNEGNYICRVSNAAGSGNSTSVISGEVQSTYNVFMYWFVECSVQ